MSEPIAYDKAKSVQVSLESHRQDFPFACR